MIPPEISVTGAEMAYAVANTPLFLLRKLQADPVVDFIRSRSNDAELLDSLVKLLSQKPTSMRDYVSPYLILVALTRSRDSGAIKAAVRMPAPHHDWFSYLAHALAQAKTPVTVSTLTPTVASTPRVALKTEINTRQVKFEPRQLEPAT